MARTIGIGIQNFENLIRNDYFYIDKTNFIKEWWESGDSVTLITRPRRFGKTLNINMLERFFSLNYAGGGEIFPDFPYGKMKNTKSCREHTRCLVSPLPRLKKKTLRLREKRFAN